MLVLKARDFNWIELLKVRFQNLAAAPGSPAEGWAYYDTTLHAFGVWNGSGWDYLGGVSNELIQDIIGATFGDSATIDFTYEDAGNTITGAVLNSPQLGGHDSAYHLARANHTGTQVAASISDFNSAVNALVNTAISALTAGAPGALDTLDELAAAINDDANFAATVTTALGLRTKKGAALIGDGASITLTHTHNLGTTDVIAQLQDATTHAVVDADPIAATINTLTWGFTVAPATNAYRSIVVG